MKFSIITITYNRAHLIGHTIQSVLNQTHTDFEHIIIDDGSTDATQEVVEGFKDERIRYFKYEKGNKLSFLRNEGFRKSSGEYIAVIDSDDLWRKDKLSMLDEVFSQKKDLAFVIHNLRFIVNENYENDSYLVYENDFYRSIFLDLLLEDILTYPIYSFRRKLLNSVGFMDENMTDGQHDFFLRIAATYPVYFISEDLAYIRKHDQNMTMTYELYPLLECLSTIDKVKAMDKISKKQYSRIVSKINYKISKFYVDNLEVKKGLIHIRNQISKSSFCSEMARYFYFYFKLYLYSKSR